MSERGGILPKLLPALLLLSGAALFLFGREATAAQQPKVKITSQSAQSGAEENVAAAVAKTNALISEALSSKEYGKYVQARQLLKDTEKIADVIKQSDKRAFAYIALAYSYARMKNDYTKSYFDSSKWKAKTPDKADKEIKDQKGKDKKTKVEFREDWTSIAEADTLIGKSVAAAAEIPSGRASEAGDICLLAAIGYEALRTQAAAGMGKLDKDFLYKKASRYINLAMSSKSTFQGINDFGAFYRKMDPWSASGVLSADVLEKTAVSIVKTIAAGPNAPVLSNVLIFENNQLSLIEGE